MWATSSQWAETIAASHRRIHRVDLLQGGLFVATLTGDGSILTAGPAGPAGGLDYFDLTVDSTASVRRSIDLYFFDPSGSLIPLTTKSYTAPFGNELRVWSGVIHPGSGVREVVPIITGQIQLNDTTDDMTSGSQGLETKVTVQDRGSTVSLNSFDTIFTVANGASAIGAVRQIIRTVFPAASITVRCADFTVPAASFDEGSDPFAAANSILSTGPAVVYADQMGDFFIIDQPDPVNNPQAATYAFVAGAGATFRKMETTADATAAYNKVIVIGEVSGSAPARGTAQDTNPNSPTFYGGPFGKRPIVYKTNLTTDVATLTGMARTYLSQILGVAQQAVIDHIPDPALDAFDYVTMTRTRLGLINTPGMVQSFTLSSDYQTAQETTVLRPFTNP